MTYRTKTSRESVMARDTTSVTYAEAVKFIKTKTNGASLFIGVSFMAPVAGDEGHVFPLYSNIKVDRVTLLDFLENAYGKRFVTEALVRIADHGTCVFFL